MLLSGEQGRFEGLHAFHSLNSSLSYSDSLMEFGARR
jgi:hypothetical protein